jgi:hypothetical protein
LADIVVTYGNRVNRHSRETPATPAAYHPIGPQSISAGPAAQDGSSKPVCGAAHATSTSVQDVRIDHRRAHVLVAQELLSGPNVVAILKEVRRKRMTERMATGRLGDPCRASGFFDGLLNDGFVQVMSVLCT